MEKLSQVMKAVGFDANASFREAKSKAREREPQFVIDEVNERVFRELSLYFANDIRFSGDLNKGILLAGDIGTGKTLLMYAFEQVRHCKQKFVIVSTNEITEKYEMGGIQNLQHYYRLNDGYPDGAYCFDDLGAEKTLVKFMGNDMNCMERIILSRYEKRFPFTFTHFTTNLNSDALERLYGSRVRSRLREMCNLLELPGEDRRK